MNKDFSIPPRKYRRFPIFQCGYRRFCSSWWAYWLNPMTYVKSIRTVYQRGTRGWADSDTFSFDWYLAHWMGDALHQLHNDSCTTWNCSEKGRRELTRMIAAWDAARHIQWNCDCYSHQDHNKRYERQWEVNIQVFVKHFFRLWW